MINSKSPLRITITAMDAAVLLMHVVRGLADKDVGFEDADRTYEQLRQELGRILTLDKSAVESALWSCNLLAEKNSFYHPDGLTFKEFTNKLAPNKRFDKLRHVWEGTYD